MKKIIVLASAGVTAAVLATAGCVGYKKSKFKKLDEKNQTKQMEELSCSQKNL